MIEKLFPERIKSYVESRTRAREEGESCPSSDRFEVLAKINELVDWVNKREKFFNENRI